MTEKITELPIPQSVVPGAVELLRVFDNVSDDAGQLDLRVEVKSSMLPDASRLGAILGEVARQIAPQISAINGIDQKTLLAILREGFNKATG